MYSYNIIIPFFISIEKKLCIFSSGKVEAGLRNYNLLEMKDTYIVLGDEVYGYGGGEEGEQCEQQPRGHLVIHAPCLLRRHG